MAAAGGVTMYGTWALVRRYAVLIIIVLLMIYMSLISDAFLTPRNLLNILNQSTPLALIAAALTLVIIGGGFDLSTGAIFGVATVSAAYIAVNVDPYLGLVLAPLVGLVLGVTNGVIITTLHVHSFLATLATSLVFRGIAILITGGFLIQVRIPEFIWLGRSKVDLFCSTAADGATSCWASVNVAVIVMVIFVALMMFLLNRTTFGRRVYAVGGNEEAAVLSGVRVNLVKIGTFTLTGVAAGLAAAVSVSRLSMGQPQAGVGMELEAIAAVILGGTSIYGGEGAVWRSVAGVLLLQLINNAFNILNVNPFYKDLTTGLIIVAAVAASAAGKWRR
jgi:ribose transport system permease protein